MHVLIVDDDAVLASQLASDLGALKHEVTCVCDGPEALAAIRRRSFDAIVLERMLPSVEGLTLLRRLRQTGVTTPVILLTALGRVSERIDGLEAGADDYLVKPVDTAELSARLHAVQRRLDWASGTSADVIEVGHLVISPATHCVWHHGTSVDLSKGEFGVLLVLARHAGAVVTRDMLYEELWSIDFKPSTNIADAYIRRLRQKLIASDSRDPIQTVRGVGYRLTA